MVTGTVCFLAILQHTVYPSNSVMVCDSVYTALSTCWPLVVLPWFNHTQPCSITVQWCQLHQNCLARAKLVDYMLKPCSSTTRCPPRCPPQWSHPFCPHCHPSPCLHSLSPCPSSFLSKKPKRSMMWCVFLHQAVWQFEIWLKHIVKPGSITT